MKWWFAKRPAEHADTSKMRQLSRQLCGASLRGEYEGDFYLDLKRLLVLAADEIDEQRKAQEGQ